MRSAKIDTTTFKKEVYRNCRIQSGLNKAQWGRLFALGNKKNTAQVVSHKENPLKPAQGNISKGVNNPESLLSQLLLFLHESGFDIQNITFSEKGEVLEIPAIRPDIKPKKNWRYIHSNSFDK